MNRRHYAIVALFSISLLVVALVPLSGQQGSSYNPWLDYNDSGIIDVGDLHALGQAYGTSGTPSNLPMALEYDSGWMDISDKHGQYFTITHNLDLGSTTSWIPSIWGTTTADGDPHQRYFDGTGYTPGWKRTYGGTNPDYVRSLVQTGDGGYALAGFTRLYGAGDYDFWLVKTDAAGNAQWNQTYGGTSSYYAYSMVQTGDGGYALAGGTVSYGAGGWDFWLVKTDSAGTILWNQTYGGTNSDYAYSLVQTGDEGYALAGYTYSYGVGTPLYSNFWLVKTDAVGTLLWNQTYGGTSPDYVRSLVQTGDGGYALAGRTDSYGAGGDSWLVKTDSAGTILWNQTYGGTNSDYAYSLVQTGDEGYALAGDTNSYGAGGVDFWLVKTDAAGNAQWNRTYGGTSSDRAWSVIQTGDGGYALAGYTNSYGAGDFDSWLVKADAFGLIEYMEIGLAITGYTADTLTLYRGKIDPYWNYAKVLIWVVKENP